MALLTAEPADALFCGASASAAHGGAAWFRAADTNPSSAGGGGASWASGAEPAGCATGWCDAPTHAKASRAHAGAAAKAEATSSKRRSRAPRRGCSALRLPGTGGGERAEANARRSAAAVRSTCARMAARAARICSYPVSAEGGIRAAVRVRASCGGGDECRSPIGRPTRVASGAERFEASRSAGSARQDGATRSGEEAGGASAFVWCMGILGIPSRRDASCPFHLVFRCVMTLGGYNGSKWR